MSENRHELWTPRKRVIEQARTACPCPPDVLISKLPRDANLITGTGIRDGALVLSPSHLKFIRFPLHPLFHVVFSALDLHPMQLSPNSYLQLSAFLALGLQVGATIDCSDFFHFHDCILIRGEVEYFHFASKPNCRTFVNKPSSHKNWKHRPLLITGNWAAPELDYLKIRSTFRVSADNFTTSPTRERIQWLNTHLAGSCLDIKEYSTPTILLRISQERTSFIYRLFQPAHLKLKQGLEGKQLTAHIVESLANMDPAFSECHGHVAERERMREKVEKRNRSGETDEAVHSFEDTDRVDLDQVEPTMVREFPDMNFSLRSKPSKLKTKRSGSSALGAKKRLKTVSDHSAFQKAAPQEIIKAMNSRYIELGQMATAVETMLKETAQNNENKDKQLGELKLKFEQERQRVSELERQLHKVEAKRDGLEADIIKVQSELAKTEKEFKNEKHIRELEYQNAKTKIKLESARHFRFGWVQALHSPNKRIVACPDDIDTHLGFEPEGYEFFLGMNPSDRRVEDASENEPEDEDDQDDEDDEENENEPEDEDDQDEDDEDDPGHPPENNQDVSNSLGRRDVDNNLDFSKHPQNSSMTHIETSPNRTYLPPQPNQETSNTTPQQKQRPLCHPAQINHPIDNNQDVETSLGSSAWSELSLRVGSSSHMSLGYIDLNTMDVGMGCMDINTTDINDFGFSMHHPQNSSMTHVQTSPNRTYLPPQPNQETSNTTPQQKQTSALCHPAQINHPVDNNQDVETSLGTSAWSELSLRVGSSSHVGPGYIDFIDTRDFSMHPPNSYMTHVETSSNRTYLPPRPNQETSNTTPQQKQTSPLCHPPQINHPVDNNQDVETSLGSSSGWSGLSLGVGSSLSVSQGYIEFINTRDFSMHRPNSSMTHVETSSNRTYLPPQPNKETLNTTPQQNQTSPLCHRGQINHPVDNNQDVENSLGSSSWSRLSLEFGSSLSVGYSSG